MSKKRKPFLVIIAVWLIAASTIAWGQQETKIAESPEFNRLRHFLMHPNPRRLPIARKDAAELEAMASRYPILYRQAVGELLQAFNNRWISGTGNKNLSINAFDIISRELSCFGTENSQLVSTLAVKTLPAAWNDEKFLRWVRKKLPAQVDGQDTTTLMLRDIPSEGTSAVRKYVFLHEILPPSKALDQRFDSVWKGMGARELSPALKETEKQIRLRSTLPDSLKRKLGNRLYDLPALTWLDASGEMEGLINASDRTAVDFLKKTSASLRANEKNGRGDKAAQLLLRLSRLVPPQTAFRELQPEADAPWFDFLNEKDILQRVCKQDERLRVQAFKTLLLFLQQGEFKRLFPHVRKTYYQWFQERCFNEILRPGAKDGVHASLVFNAALAGDFSTDHRAILARDCLGGGEPLAPAWPGPDAKPRLRIAIDLYKNLLNPTLVPKVPARTLKEHLNRPLLSEILLACTGLIENDSGKKLEAFQHLKAIGKHLANASGRAAISAGIGPSGKWRNPSKKTSMITCKKSDNNPEKPVCWMTASKKT